MTDINITKRKNRSRRQVRGRAKIVGTADRPRVTVFKGNVHVYVQAIDDAKGVTLAAVNDKQIAKKGTKTERAAVAGTKLAELLKAKKISAVVFDKAGFTYHGRVRAVADALRSAGITL